MCCNKASLFDSYDSIKKFDRYLIGNRICKKTMHIDIKRMLFVLEFKQLLG